MQNGKVRKVLYNCFLIILTYFRGLMAYDEELLNSLPDQPLMDME